MLRNPRYVIAVHDLEASARFYRDVLAFEIVPIPDPGWLFFVRDECFIMAGRCPDAIPPRDLGDHSYFAYIEVDDVETFHQTVVARGAELVKPLTAEPWGMTEFGIRTSDGHRIMFGEERGQQ
jgi:predicted enzyme related to lactoylglutathione lyase